MRNWVALATTICGGLSLALAVINAGLTYSDRGAQQAQAQRLEYIAQTQQVARAGQIVVTALAEAAQHSDDAAIRTLLTSNGVTIRQAPAAADLAAPSAPTIPAPTTPAPATH